MLMQESKTKPEGEVHYPVSLVLRIDWSELDLFGHVNNVAFMKYIQTSRMHCWEQAQVLRYASKQQAPILASTTCHFLKPLHYPGQVQINARLSFIKNTSFGFTHQLYNQHSEQVSEAEKCNGVL